MAPVASVHLRAAAARRIALAAQGFARPRPTSTIGHRHIRQVFRNVGLLQIDSVNAVARSHELVLFSRLGPYPRGLLHDLTTARELFEYWGHEASILPVEIHPFLRWRMARAADGHAWRRLVELRRRRPELLESVRETVAATGPLRASAFTRRTTERGPWWGWSDHKAALEMLFWLGEITCHSRTASFERTYDLTDRVLPAAVLARPTPSERDAHKELMRRAIGHLGVATAADAADYFRITATAARPLLDELVADGVLAAATVDGWRDPAYLDPTVTVPRRIRARALLSPFDSLVWCRPRAERIFDFRYRLELYTPASKRVYGYYVLPFLLGDELVARVDVRADRRAGVLRIPGAFGEGRGDLAHVVEELASELWCLAEWLGLTSVMVGEDGRGDLALPLRAHLDARTSRR